MSIMHERAMSSPEPAFCVREMAGLCNTLKNTVFKYDAF